MIVKGDRLWSVFTLRASHVGTLYGQPATGKDLAITEMCCIRFEDGKLAEGWFLGDEVSICRQIGIDDRGAACLGGRAGRRSRSVRRAAAGGEHERDRGAAKAGHRLRETQEHRDAVRARAPRRAPT